MMKLMIRLFRQGAVLLVIAITCACSSATPREKECSRLNRECSRTCSVQYPRLQPGTTTSQSDNMSQTRALACIEKCERQFDNCMKRAKRIPDDPKLPAETN